MRGAIVSNAGSAELDLGRAPYVVYGVKYIDLVSLCPPPQYFAV